MVKREVAPYLTGWNDLARRVYLMCLGTCGVVPDCLPWCVLSQDDERLREGGGGARLLRHHPGQPEEARPQLVGPSGVARRYFDKPVYRTSCRVPRSLYLYVAPSHHQGQHEEA
jgi:hypothetical protein